MGQLEKNQNRNRFVDIIPYDDNYVSLQVTRISIHSEVTSLIFFFRRSKAFPHPLMSTPHTSTTSRESAKWLSHRSITGIFCCHRTFFWSEYIQNPHCSGSKTEHSVGLLANGPRAQGAPRDHADQQSRTGWTHSKRKDKGYKRAYKSGGECIANYSRVEWNVSNIGLRTVRCCTLTTSPSSRLTRRRSTRGWSSGLLRWEKYKDKTKNINRKSTGADET